MDNFWSHYWLYRALTPDNRVYMDSGSRMVAPAYTGFWSILWDILSLIIVITILFLVIRWIVKKKKKKSTD
jgi:F0F1-type ATP synthase membrane subunit a